MLPHNGKTRPKERGHLTDILQSQYDIWMLDGAIRPFVGDHGDIMMQESMVHPCRGQSQRLGYDVSPKTNEVFLINK
jgi:hypothetical protein